MTSASGKCYYPHFTDEETEDFHDQMSHPEPTALARERRTSSKTKPLNSQTCVVQ